MGRPYSILAIYKPEIWKCWHIGRDITRITRHAGLRPFDFPDTRYARAPWSNPELHAHVRRRTLRKEDGAQWHQDGDYGHVPMEHGLVFWANTSPTEIRDIEGKVWYPKPYEVIYINNLEVYHRRPVNAPRHRYFFRQRVQPS